MVRAGVVRSGQRRHHVCARGLVERAKAVAAEGGEEAEKKAGLTAREMTKETGLYKSGKALRRDLMDVRAFVITVGGPIKTRWQGNMAGQMLGEVWSALHPHPFHLLARNAVLPRFS